MDSIKKRPEPILEISGLTKEFGKFRAVDNISFDILDGEILGFLGPNGAGKTTTIKMITGLLKKSSGTISFEGKDISSDMGMIKDKIGYMSQKFSLYAKLSAVENTEFFAGISGLGREEVKKRMDEIEKNVTPRLSKIPVEKLPPGIRQKVALYVSLIPDPQILLLDEPTSGVDPEVRREFWKDIYDLKKTGKTILVTTHNLDEVEYADRIIILHHGKIIVSGEPGTLLKEHGKNSIEELFREAVN